MPPDPFALVSRAASLHCAGGILESKAGQSMTTRNGATVLKLHGLAQPAST